MKHATIYTDAPRQVTKALARAKAITDTLPPPNELVRRKPKTKITITLNTRSVEFFKRFAKEHDIKYQTMINDILDTYAQRYA